jgi:signal transduction histidine kinase
LADLAQINWLIEGINGTMGDIYLALHNSDSAMHYFRKAFSHSSEESGAKGRTALKIAKILNARGQLDSCLNYAEIALQYALDNNLYSSIAEANLFLSGLYETRDAANALQYNKTALAYKDSLIYLNQQSGFSELIDLEELQRQREFEATQKAYRDKIRLYLLLGGLAVLLFITFLLYRNNRNKQKARKKIEEAYHQLQSTQSQLIQSEKMASLGELTAGIAHEIQNPLNFVNNFSEVNTELIEEATQEIEKGNTVEVKEILKDIKENESKINHHGKRADAIVKGMLQHSKGSSGQKEPTDINALCDEYLRLSYHGLRAKDKSFNAKFETDFDSSPPKLNVVPQDIGRVVLNLINNAFYVVNEKQKVNNSGYEPIVTVSTKRVGDQIEISVKDNGPGIPDSIKGKIFQPFFTTKPTGQGTGLGLSLSYDIVKAHGGEIKVETKEGEGTTFILNLPLV